jgi:integrase
VSVYKRGKIYWYKFTWNGELIRESTKQGNPRVARQMEAAHKTSLAKGEVGIREKKAVPTLRDFATGDFTKHVSATFAAKVKTRKYYENGIKALLGFESLADARLDAISSEKISAYASKRQSDGLEISSINRELQVLRRMFHLAQEWSRVEKVLPKVRMLPGERRRDRVVTPEEEQRYLAAAPPLLREVGTVLIDTAVRPEECFRMRWSDVDLVNGHVQVQHGKTQAACRKIPLTPRVIAILSMRKGTASTEWVFPAPTQSGHIEPSSIKKQQKRAFLQSGVAPFDLYSLRHTCLTRWAPHMDPFTLGYLAGHTDMSITRRYVHPQQGTVREAMQRVSGHKSGHSAVLAQDEPPVLAPAIN